MFKSYRVGCGAGVLAHKILVSVSFWIYDFELGWTCNYMSSF